MGSPALAEPIEDEEPEAEEIEDEEPEAEPEPEPESEDDPEVVEVNPEDDLTADNGLFDDIDDADESSGSSDEPADPLDDLDGRGEALEDAINDGAARLAVVGIDDDGLEDEFQDVFSAFRLGFFGSKFAEEYVMVQDDESIDPAWGLVGSMICCLAVVMWMRPDGDEQLAKLQRAIGGIGGAS